jgi:hypothetical protein
MQHGLPGVLDQSVSSRIIVANLNIVVVLFFFIMMVVLFMRGPLRLVLEDAGFVATRLIDADFAIVEVLLSLVLMLVVMLMLMVVSMGLFLFLLLVPMIIVTSMPMSMSFFCPMPMAMTIPMSVTISFCSMDELMRVKHDFVNDEDEGVARENEQVGQREGLLLLRNHVGIVELHVLVVVVDSFRENVHQGNSQEDSSGESYADTQELRTFFAFLRLRRHNS